MIQREGSGAAAEHHDNLGNIPGLRKSQSALCFYQEVKAMNALRPLFDALLMMTFMVAAGTGLAILLR
ncbi:MAG TPA: hypothetical protein VJT11_06270 [Nitrospiraceae bacterium]|nr:hypothetical protein [Nitrospiraceae bacterium]